MAWGHFWSKNHNLNTLGRVSLGDLDKKFSQYKSMLKHVTGGGVGLVMTNLVDLHTKYSGSCSLG